VELSQDLDLTPQLVRQTKKEKMEYNEDKDKLIQAFQTIRIITACQPYSANLQAGVTALLHNTG
jgi:hypothetical protein